jgi:hypothetical protein
MNQFRGAFQLSASALLVAALVQGCGGSASTSSVPLEEFPNRLAKVVCDSLVGCCRALSFPLDPATCNANASAYFRTTFGAQDRSRIRYDGSDADACLSAYGTVLRGCTLGEADGQALVAACQPVFVGLVPVGGACKSGDECAVPASGQARCEFFGSGSVGEGTCVVDTSSPGAALHGKQGEACAGSCASSTCGGVSPSGPGGGSTTTCFASEGLYCSDQGTCQPVLVDGQACSYFECKQESYCADAGACAPKKPDGAVCVESSECLAHNCAYPDDPSASSTGTCGVLSLADAKTCAGNFE